MKRTDVGVLRTRGSLLGIPRGMVRTRAFLVLFLGLLLACGNGDERVGRALLVGIDGATLRVIRPLMEEGKLPNLERIAREGVHGPLRSHHPLLSPRIWTSIATGKAPKKHGIEGFIHKDERERAVLYLSHDRKAHALWNIASDNGLEVGVVNWLYTQPPEKIHGVMVSDHAIPGASKGRRWLGGQQAKNLFGKPLSSDEDVRTLEAAGVVAYPEMWLEKVLAIVERETPVAEARTDNPFKSMHDLSTWINRDVLSRSFRNDWITAQIALEVKAAIKPDLLMVLLLGIDPVSHMLWGTLEPPDAYPEHLRPTDSERQAGADALRRYYQYTDTLIGLIVDQFGPEDLVIVASDHGFEVQLLGGGITGGHYTGAAVNGVIFARGPGIPAGEEAGEVTVNDITPTILAWLGLPVAADMDGRAAPFLQVPLKEPIPTYDTTPIERLSAAATGAEDTILDQLRALGYIE